MFYKLLLCVQGFFANFVGSYFFSETQISFGFLQLYFGGKKRQQNLRIFSTIRSCTQPQKLHLCCLLARMQQKADFSHRVPRQNLPHQRVFRFLFAHLFCIRL